jgi:hypothetical protein
MAGVRFLEVVELYELKIGRMRVENSVTVEL